MKKNRIFGMLSAALLLLAGACSSDTLEPGSKDGPNNVNPEDGVYLSVVFDFKNGGGTRSYTSGENSSNSGTEVGSDIENNIQDVYIVLAKTDNSFIACARKETVAVGTNGISYRSTAKFTKTKLAEYYEDEDFDIDQSTSNHKVNVFVFCNPTDGLANVLNNAKFNDKIWYDAIGVYDESLNEGCIWGTTANGDGYFLMSNSSICTRLFPSTLEAWNDYTSESTAFNLSGVNNFGRPNEVDNLNHGRGNVTVERAAARYDFRDGALDGYDKDGANGFKAQTYHVLLDSKEQPLVDVFLGKMSMVNMNKEFYFLRRVSSNGFMTGNNLMICGPELPWFKNANGGYIEDENGNNVNGNYVVDPFAVWKASTPTNGFDGHFNYPFFNNEGKLYDVDPGDRWYTSVISKVLEGENDNPESWNADGAKKGYKKWRYLTEGTVPGVSTQNEGVINGVVFKGQLQAAARPADANDDEFTQKLLDALKIRSNPEGNNLSDPILYSYNGHLYCTWEHIRRMAVQLAITNIKYNATENKWDFTLNRSVPLYNAVFGNGGFGTMTFSGNRTEGGEINFLTTAGTESITDDVAEDETSANYLYNQWKAEPVLDEQFIAFRDAAVGKLITLYQTSYDSDLGGWGYYCYYFYWNRHNDNGDDTVMCPMEFDVVRNNVYKLAVTRISRLGHPRVVENDPDKPTPDTPAEKADVYISVTCTALPWVVRINNANF